MRIVTLSIIACFTSLASAHQRGDFVIVVSPSVEMRDKAEDGAVIVRLLNPYNLGALDTAAIWWRN